METVKGCSVEDVKGAYEAFNRLCRERLGHLPLQAPRRPSPSWRGPPQPRYDAELDGGMTTLVGRIEKCDLGPNWVKYLVLSNNLKKGVSDSIKGTHH